MASLNTTNPHSKKSHRGNNQLCYQIPSDISSEEVERMWKKCSGDAVEDDSKRFMAFIVNQKEFIMADIRFVSLAQSSGTSRVVLEFFYDGETDYIPSVETKENFMSGLQGRISWSIDEYYRRLIQSRAGDRTFSSSLRSLKRLDDVALPVGAHIEDAFRDAGCMLRFVATRVSVTPECAFCIGSLVFPEHFGVISGTAALDKSERLPAWIVAMGVSTVIIGIAMVYAWVQILVIGNSATS